LRTCQRKFTRDKIDESLQQAVSPISQASLYSATPTHYEISASVSDTTGQTPAQWSDMLLWATAELRQQFAGHRDALPATALDDFDRLFEAAGRLETMTAEWVEGQSTHDLMNVLSALRGYSEMLREDLDGSPADLDGTLARLLSAVQTVHMGETSEENKTDTGSHRAITSEGREVLRRIKDHPEWRATPVIVISGRQDMDDIIECIEAGADDYLFKPFNPVLLQARIKAGIERKRWHDREEQYRQQLERNEKFIRATFGRYLSDEIVTDILETPEGLELGGDLREVTIMMSDIRGFTTLSEQLEPAQVVKMLNRYLGVMTEIIMAHNGTIDEFIGDAILTVFGAPKRSDDDADNAVRCALAMQAAMDRVNSENAAEGLPQVLTGIALNTGMVIAGNIGSERRSKYGFVGHPMNVTSRIEDQSAGGEILISASTLEKLKDDYEVGERRELKVKGIEETVVIHPIRERASD
jgi:class 3 adenylate cyclase